MECDPVAAERRAPAAQLAAAGWIAPFGGEVTDFDPKELIQPRKSIKVMSRDIQLASAAAELAWQDSCLSQATLDPERFGVVGGAGVMYCDLEELRGPFLEWIKAGGFRYSPLVARGDGRAVSAVDAEVSAEHAGVSHRHSVRCARAEQHDCRGRRVVAARAERGGRRDSPRARRRDDRGRHGFADQYFGFDVASRCAAGLRTASCRRPRFAGRSMPGGADR